MNEDHRSFSTDRSSVGCATELSTALTTAMSSAGKTKLAPRSSLQFKVGPQFIPTANNYTIHSITGKHITPIITPRIDRGFEKINGEWIGYKRNYFTLVCSFRFTNHSFTEFLNDSFYAENPLTRQRTAIRYFGLRLISKCAEDGADVSLVQHTAKRDRGPQFAPPIYPAVPSELPHHDVIRTSANVRNISKIAKLDQVFYFERNEQSCDSESYKTPGLRYYPDNRIAKVARYERIQFSSSINYKKPSSSNKRFKLCVELVGFTTKNEFITLAYTETPPLIVRGRSPSNYSHESADILNISNTSCNMLDIDFDNLPISKTVKTNKGSKLPKSKTKVCKLAKSKPLKIPKSQKVQAKRDNQNSKQDIPEFLDNVEIAKIIDEIPKDEDVSIKFDIPDFLEKSLDDLDTYAILLNANRDLDQLAEVNSIPMWEASCTNFNTEKAKKGRKPKNLLHETLKRKPLSKPKSVSKSKGSKTLIDKDCNDKKKITLSKVKERKSLDKLNHDLKVEFPEPADFQLENFDFNSSIGDIDLIESKAKQCVQYFVKLETLPLEYDDHQNLELFLLKSRAEQLRQDQETNMLDYFSNMQSNPSDMLVDDFEDGPNSIVY